MSCEESVTTDVGTRMFGDLFGDQSDLHLVLHISGNRDNSLLVRTPRSNVLLMSACLFMTQSAAVMCSGPKSTLLIEVVTWIHWPPVYRRYSSTLRPMSWELSGEA
jgi:hypothetical protein